MVGITGNGRFRACFRPDRVFTGSNWSWIPLSQRARARRLTPEERAALPPSVLHDQLDPLNDDAPPADLVRQVGPLPDDSPDGFTHEVDVGNF